MPPPGRWAEELRRTFGPFTLLIALIPVRFTCTLFAAYDFGLLHHLFNLSQDFIDVAVVCDDAILSKAHKVVLAKYI